ncbi:PRA1 family protein B3-like [Amaranthus tricolor]|uniref:PRA1 family protein B3-like n=1 Tax=Amaranthus tricolor TaxID=29722 RepID=UPI00258DF4EB|nr:PRA1 family protein B3-like [Amaranthus tricolor]
MPTPLLVQITRSVSLSPSFRTFISRIGSSIHRACSRHRPWLELFEFAAYSRPQSLSNSTTRIRKNVSYFWTNYLTLIGGVLAFSLLSHPLSLLSLLLLLAAWIFLYFFKPSEQPLILLGHTLSNNEILAILVGATLTVMFFTSVASLIISATLIGVAIVCLHGAFRDPAELFLDEQDRVSSSSLFSIANGASMTSIPASVREVVSIV